MIDAEGNILPFSPKSNKPLDLSSLVDHYRIVKPKQFFMCESDVLRFLNRRKHNISYPTRWALLCFVFEWCRLTRNGDSNAHPILLGSGLSETIGVPARTINRAILKGIEVGLLRMVKPPKGKQPGSYVVCAKRFWNR